MTQKTAKNKLKSRQGLLLAFLFFIITAAGLCTLGVWQLHRAVWKQGLVDQSQAALALPALVFHPAVPYPQWQPLRVTGRFDTRREAVLESQTGPNHTPGYRIVTPLIVGHTEVLVDRGWIPRDFTPGFLDRYTPQKNTFTAVVRFFPQRHGWLQGPTESYGAARTLVFFDPAALPGLDGITRLGYYLQASSPTHEGVEAFVATPDQAISPAQHRQYAFTWFACASLWLACGVYYAFSVLRVKAPSGRGASGQKGPKAAGRRGR